MAAFELAGIERRYSILGVIESRYAPRNSTHLAVSALPHEWMQAERAVSFRTRLLQDAYFNGASHSERSEESVVELQIPHFVRDDKGSARDDNPSPAANRHPSQDLGAILGRVCRRAAQRIRQQCGQASGLGT
jgi:hypothetical protein